MAACTRRQFNALALAVVGRALGGCGPATDGTVSAAMGQVTLSYARFPQLARSGGSVVVGVSGSFPLVVVRIDDASATALSATCTHAGCLVEFSASSDQIHCPCHDANFALDGSVQSGPTAIPLPVYQATVGPDAVVVSLS